MSETSGRTACFPISFGVERLDSSIAATEGEMATASPGKRVRRAGTRVDRATVAN